MCTLQKGQDTIMDTQALANARRKKLRELLAINKDGIVSIPKLAAKLQPDDNVQQMATERKLYKCAAEKKPTLLPFALITLIAPILNVEPSDMYISLTADEKAVAGGTVPDTTIGSTRSTRKKKTSKRTAKKESDQRHTVLRVSNAAGSKSKNGLPLPINCPVLGVNFQDYLKFDGESQTFQGQNCRVTKVDGVLHLLVSAPIGAEGAAALLALVTN
jgi:hypothetical protein